MSFWQIFNVYFSQTRTHKASNSRMTAVRWIRKRKAKKWSWSDRSTNWHLPKENLKRRQNNRWHAWDYNCAHPANKFRALPLDQSVRYRHEVTIINTKEILRNSERDSTLSTLMLTVSRHWTQDYRGWKPTCSRHSYVTDLVNIKKKKKTFKRHSMIIYKMGWGDRKLAERWT
jgi:hypothetical protein